MSGRMKIKQSKQKAVPRKQEKSKSEPTVSVQAYNAAGNTAPKTGLLIDLHF